MRKRANVTQKAPWSPDQGLWMSHVGHPLPHAQRQWQPTGHEGTETPQLLTQEWVRSPEKTCRCRTQD